MSAEDDIKRFAEESLTDSQHFIVDVVVSARKGPKKVLVIVDGDSGVTIDDCAEISRALGKRLEETPVLGDESYMLEVSTPGVDQPLKMTRQYRRHVGRKLKVKLRETVLEGKLDELMEDGIRLSVETGTGKKKEIKNHEIRFDEIEKAFVLVSFK
jgi:ribosome maturation factor RimP